MGLQGLGFRGSGIQRLGLTEGDTRILDDGSCEFHKGATTWGLVFARAKIFEQTPVKHQTLSANAESYSPGMPPNPKP